MINKIFRESMDNNGKDLLLLERIRDKVVFNVIKLINKCNLYIYVNL